MEHAWAKRDDHQEQQSDSGVEFPADGRIQTGLARRADEGQCKASSIKLYRLSRTPDRAHFANHSVEEDIQPTSDGVLGGILPRLESVAMVEEMCRLPVIEGLVAILNGRIRSSESIGYEKHVEGHIQREIEYGWPWPATTTRISIGNIVNCSDESDVPGVIARSSLRLSGNIDIPPS